MSEALHRSALDPFGDRRLPVSKGVLVSIGIHVLLVGGFVAMSFMEPPKLDITQKPISAKLVRLGKKRDEKLLPRKEQPQPPPAAEPLTIPVPSSKPNPVAKPPEPVKHAEKPSKPDRSRMFDAFAKTAAKPEERTGEETGDPEGDADKAEEGERYFGLILAKARRNYTISKTISPAELVRLKAVVVLYINATGELLKDPQIQTSSGNEQFDNDVVLALKKAAPFGPPPKDLAKTLKTVGVAVEATP